MNNTSNQLDLTDTCRMLNLTTTDYTYFSSKHDICRDRPYIGLKNKFWFILKDWIFIDDRVNN